MKKTLIIQNITALKKINVKSNLFLKKPKLYWFDNIKLILSHKAKKIIKAKAINKAIIINKFCGFLTSNRSLNQSLK